MVRITKRGLTKATKKKILNFILKEIKNIRTVGDLNKFLSQILTPEEQIMIEKRSAIALFLKEGKRNKDIREILDVSKSTISFVKRGLIRLPKKERVLGKITKRDLKEIKKPPWYPAYKGKGRWQFLNRL